MRHRYRVLRPYAARAYAVHYWRYCWQRSIFLLFQICHGHAEWRAAMRRSPTWNEPSTPLPPPPAWLAAMQELGDGG